MLSANVIWLLSLPSNESHHLSWSGPRGELINQVACEPPKTYIRSKEVMSFLCMSP